MTPSDNPRQEMRVGNYLVQSLAGEDTDLFGLLADFIKDPQEYNERLGCPICPTCQKDITPEQDCATVLETGVAFHVDCVPSSVFK